MPRLLSVSLTEAAVRERQKTVTRRLGWWTDKNGRRLLHVGERLTLCRKVMGRKPGEPLVRLAEVEVTDVRRERLDAITPEDVAREGFPGRTALAGEGAKHDFDLHAATAAVQRLRLGGAGAHQRHGAGAPGDARRHRRPVPVPARLRRQRAGARTGRTARGGAGASDMRVLFAASRHAGPQHRQAIADALLSVLVSTGASGPHVLIVGRGRGGDKIAEEVARSWGWRIEGYPADWDRLGRFAGPARNADMVAAGADRVVAMPDGRGMGSGTGDLIRRAVDAGLPVNIRPLRIEEATLL